MRYDIDHRPRLLAIGDYVVFNKLQDLEYVVRAEFLNCEPDNSAIFRDLGFDTKEKRYAFCNLHYQYRTNGGAWPQCNLGDLHALTRLVNAIFELIQGESFVGVICRNEMKAVLKLLATGNRVEPLADQLTYVQTLQKLRYKAPDGSTSQLVKKLRGGGYIAPKPMRLEYLLGKLDLETIKVRQLVG